MALPKLEFGKTKLIGDPADSGSSDLPDPDSVEFASPELAGVDSGDEVAAEEVSNTPGEAAADPTTIDDIAGDAAPAKPKKVEYASDPDEDDDDSAAVSTGDFNDELLAQAAVYGYDADAAKRFGSPENLQWAIADADRRAAELAQKLFANVDPQQSQQQQVAPPPGQQAPAAAQQPPAPQASAAAAAAKYALDRAKLIEKGFDEDSLDVLEGMNDHYAAKMAEQQQFIDALREIAVANFQGLNQVTGRSQADEQTQFARDMDTFFTELGPEWEADFGKGSINELVPNSPAWTKRREIVATMFGLQQSDAQLNRTPATNKQLSQRAFNALHFKKQQELARKALADKAGKRRSQAVARPGGQRAAPMTGDEKAFKRAEAFSRKLPQLT